MKPDPSTGSGAGKTVVRQKLRLSGGFKVSDEILRRLEEQGFVILEGSTEVEDILGWIKRIRRDGKHAFQVTWAPLPDKLADVKTLIGAGGKLVPGGYAASATKDVFRMTVAFRPNIWIRGV